MITWVSSWVYSIRKNIETLCTHCLGNVIMSDYARSGAVDKWIHDQLDEQINKYSKK